MPWFTKKERRMQVSDFPAIFKADFGIFRPFSSLSRLYRPPADTTWCGRYGPILAESTRFGANRSRFGTNRAASARIEPSWRESEKKKKKIADAVQHPGNRVGRGCGTSGAASVLSRQGFIREVNLPGIWYPELEFMKINPSIFLSLIWIQMLRQP